MVKEKKELEEKKKTSTKKKTTNRINTDKAKKKTTKAKAEKVVKAETKEEIVKDEKVMKKEAMNNKNDNASSMFSFFEVIIIAFIAAVVGILFTTGFYSLNGEKENNTPNEFEEFLNVYDELVDGYYGDVDKKGMLEAGIKGMVEYLGDPNSYYLDYDSSYSLNEELEGEFVGMGATITVDDNGNVYILELYPDSPGVKAGFMVGDIIKKVDGVEMTSKNVTEVSYKVKGKEGTKVDITILRGDEEKTITLTRGRVELQSVSSFVTDEDKNVGYIGISVFAKNTPKQFKKAMDELLKQNVNSVIIDVRSNSGGYLDVANEIASMFLEKDSVVYQLDTKGEIEKIKTTSDKIYDVDVVVLVDGGSASAAEILAAALNENINAPLVGTQTFGKGTVQRTRMLESGAMIKYTIQEWYTPKGNKVDTIGLTPTYIEELSQEYCDNPTFDRDNQYHKAIEILKK